MTVEENLLMGTIPVGSRYQNEDKARMYQLFPRLEERRAQRAMTLSGANSRCWPLPGIDEPAKTVTAG